jgi:hypothetical protein
MQQRHNNVCVKPDDTNNQPHAKKEDDDADNIQQRIS